MTPAVKSAEHVKKVLKMENDVKKYDPEEYVEKFLLLSEPAKEYVCKLIDIVGEYEQEILRKANDN